MADVNANIGVNISTSNALAQLKNLQRQISDFHTSIARSSKAAAIAQKSFETNLISSINATGKFSAELRTIKTTAESFSSSLEKNKLSMREYFKYAGASTKTFGKLFASEFDTISTVAEERVKKLQTQYIKMGRDASGAMKAIAVIPNELNMGDFATKTQIAAQKQALFNQLIKQGSTNLLNFGKNTQWAGRQLMVGFTLPLITLGSVASRTFMDMETAAIKFRKVYGDLLTPQSETLKALDNVKQLGSEFTKYGIAVSQTVDLAAQAAAAGFKGADLERQTIEATRLSVLGQIDQQKALETTISLQNAFKISSTQLTDAINFLNAVENQTVTSLDDITTAIPKVAPVIMQLGGNVKDLAFFLTAMKEGGVNASEGANALKSGLASLINPTKKASNMLAAMGINIKGIVEKNRGNLRATVLEFAKALNTLDPLSRARAIEQLFGKFQFARLSTLFQNVTKDGTQAARVLDLANASMADLANTAEKELNITAQSPMNKFKKAVEDLKVAIVPLGELFLQIATPIVNFATSVADKFSGLSENTKKVIGVITIAIAGIGPIVLMTFGLLANALANIIKLGLTLRNGYLRLTGQSKQLGSETQYLTTEQLDAAAVAASLEQSHARLTQQFNVEAASVEKLALAYEQAILAGSKFAGMNPGLFLPGRMPKKFAMGGIVNGPGNGTSDSIVARVSNGEAIIPAKSVARYPDVVSSLVAGNIPGFVNGLDPNDAPVRTYTNAVMLLQKLTNQRLKTGTESSALASEISAGGAGIQAPIVRAIAESLGATKTSEIVTLIRNNPNMKEFATSLSAGIAEEIAKTGGKITDPQLSKIYQDVARREGKRFGFSSQIEQFLTTPTTFEDNTIQRQSAKSGRIRSIGRAQLFEGIRSYRTMAYGTVAKELGLADIKGLVKAHVTEPIITTFKNLSTSTATLTKAAKAASQRQLSAVEQGVVSGIDQAAQSASPSRRAKKSGKNISDGAIIGIESEVKNARVAGAKIGAAATSAMATSGVISQSMGMQAIFSNIEQQIANGPGFTGPSGPTSKLKKPLMQRIKGGLSGRVGFGTAMIGSMAAPMIAGALPDKIGGTDISGAKSFASNAAMFGSMGSMFGGYGAAAGVAVAGIIALTNQLSNLKKREEEHRAAAAASFSASTSVAQIFGNSIADVSGKLITLPPPIYKSAAALTKAAEEANKFKEAISKLDDSDPLKKFVKSLEENKGSALRGRVRQYVASQVASGAVKPGEQAKQLTLDILTASGHAQDFELIWSQISKSVSTKTIAMATQFRKMGNEYKNAQENYTKIANEYGKYSVVAQEAQQKVNEMLKNYGDQIMVVVGQAEAGAISQKNFANKVDAMSKSGFTATQQLDAFRIAIVASGDKQSIANLEANKTLMDQIASSTLDATDRMYAYIAAQAMGAALQEQLDRVDGSSTQDRLNRASMIGRKYVENSIAIAKAKAKADAVTQDTTTTSDLTGKGTDKRISLLDKEINALQKKLDLQKTVNDEMKRQNDYTMKQMELSKSMVQAKISGDYLSAAMLGQQKKFGAAEFNAESNQLNIDSRIKYLETIQEKIKAKTPLSAAEKLSVAQIKSGKVSTQVPANVQMSYPKVSSMSSFSAGNYQMSPLSVPSNNSGTYATAGAGTVYNTITMNISGSNPEEIAKKVIAKINLVNSKNNGSNKVKS